MRQKSLKILVVFLFLAFATVVSGQKQPAGLSSKLNQYFTALTKLKNFNGNVIISKNGRVLLDKTYNISGEKSELKVNKESKFIIASVSKVFIKYGILKLVELKKLRLDETLDKIIPDFPNGEKITVEQLMYHKSGLPRELTDVETYQNLPLTRIVELAKLEKLQFSPGTQTLYSNVGYFLLHYIIEKRSPEGYSAFLKNEILKKLNLKNTGEFNTAESLSNFSYGFDKEDGKIIAAPKESINRAETGNVYSTINDLDSFSRQFLTGKVLDKSLAKKMFDENGILAQAGGRPGYRAYFYKDLKTDVSFIFLANFTDIPIQQMTADIINILSHKPYQVPREINRVEIKLPASVLQKYVGKFALEADLTQTLTFELANGKLFIVDQDGAKTEIHPDSETTFFEDPKSNDGYIFTLNPQTDKYELTVISTGIKLKTKRIK